MKGVFFNENHKSEENTPGLNPQEHDNKFLYIKKNKKLERQRKKKKVTVLHRKISCKNGKIKVLVRREKGNTDKRFCFVLFSGNTNIP